MHAFDGFGGGWMMIIWLILVILLAIVLVKVIMNSSDKKRDESPMDILEKRYARGEIDKEEFEERKNQLLK
ncbi:MAG TPA: SHOCT domain-containing protein [Balneolaceae bacterium]|nr:SHOCT domain-containing protein [Balneolaceae bacterium]